jgi:hypothetical protein
MKLSENSRGAGKNILSFEEMDIRDAKHLKDICISVVSLDIHVLKELLNNTYVKSALLHDT